MLLSELMAGITPSPTYEGVVTADDMVLALNLASTPATSPTGYIVCDDGITEQSGSLDAQTTDKQYIRRGKVTNKTSTARGFNIAGDRIVGDAFQDAILAHAVKFGNGQKVVFDYVYFCSLTGKGEKGKVSVVVSDDLAGAAGEDATFGATLTSRGTPAEYTYSAT